MLLIFIDNVMVDYSAVCNCLLDVACQKHVFSVCRNEDIQIEIAVDASLHSVMELWFITRQKRDVITP